MAFQASINAAAIRGRVVRRQQRHDREMQKLSVLLSGLASSGRYLSEQRWFP